MKKLIALLLAVVFVLGAIPLTALANDVTYTVTVRGSHASRSDSGAGRYSPGDTVYIDAGSRSGYAFDGWSTTGGQRVSLDERGRRRTSFTMPEGNVTVTANWYGNHSNDCWDGDCWDDDCWYDDRYDDRWYDYSWSDYRWHDDLYDHRSFYDRRYYNRLYDNNLYGDSRAVSSTPANTSANVTNAVNSAVTAARAAGSTSATVNLPNLGEISLSTLQTMARLANMPLRLQADNISLNGGIDVRITLDPANATRNLSLSASTQSTQATQIKNHFSKFFSNDIMAVCFGQQGSFGQSVTISAWLAPDLNTHNLVFYAYNSETNSQNRLPADNHRIDQNGYIHFETEIAGTIIISDGPLSPL